MAHKENLPPPRSTGLFIHNPATGKPIAEVLEHDPSVVPLAVRQARESHLSWSKVPWKEKERIAREASRWIHRNAETLVDTIASCTGKTRAEALATEVLPAAVAFPYYARLAEKILRPKRLKPSSFLFYNKRSILRRLPYGVVGIITPWNYPFGIPAHEVAAALLAGNGVILKVATQCQPVGELIRTLVEESGFPPGIFHLLHLKGSLAGKALVESGIDKLFFTGSTETGKLLMQEAGKRLVPLSLELGGKDAMIVLSDAPLERAAAGAVWAGVSNCGQSCGGVERIYVERSVYEPFLQLLRAEVLRLRQGWPHADFGSLTAREQRDKIESQVREATERGARLIETSPPPEPLLEVRAYPNGPDAAEAPQAISIAEGTFPLFFPAQIVEVEKDDGPLMREETFGPILAVSAVESEEEAVQRANDSIYGLTASVWSLSRKRAERVTQRLQAGVVTINDHLMTHGMPETPWGGFKQSGIGRTHGEAGMEEMTQLQVVVEERLPWLKRNIFWQPVDSTVFEGLRGALQFVGGKGFRERWVGTKKLLRLVWERVRF